MKVAEYVANFVAGLSPRVYGVCGAGAMHLNDAIANHLGIKVIAMQHEQAAAMAAEAEARVTGQMSVVMVTAGPGGTNAMTGIACAYVDSIPMLVIAGQVTTNTMIGLSGARQVGMNELNMVALNYPITKASITVLKAETVASELDAAVYLANTGRKGPVFIEFPLDVQAAQMPENPERFVPDDIAKSDTLTGQAELAARRLKNAERPLVMVGHGVRLADAVDLFRDVFRSLGYPVVSSWGGVDIMPNANTLYLGRCGIFGDRASNIAVQTADVILAIGTRLTVAQTGHTTEKFAPGAYKIIVDIDETEVNEKPTVKADLPIVADAKDFLRAFALVAEDVRSDWADHCRTMKARLRELPHENPSISAYTFADALPLRMDPDAVVVTDVGFGYIPMFQRMVLRTNQRLIHSHGVSPMGWGIPAVIGAAFGSQLKMARYPRQIVCLTGDGGAMLNLQELQTIAYHKLPIVIFVFENNGYATMKIAQTNHFKREVMAGPQSGLTLPDFTKVASAFGIDTLEFNTWTALEDAFGAIFSFARKDPILVVLHMDQKEVIAPRVMARTENGKFLPSDLADLWPYLPREEFDMYMKGSSDVLRRPDGSGQEVLRAH